jgi:cytidylate kinase
LKNYANFLEKIGIMVIYKDMNVKVLLAAASVVDPMWKDLAVTQKIFIAGLTAAGKTTHSKLLASEFSLRYVSGSSLLFGYANLDSSTLPKDFWVTSASYSLRQQREKDQSMDRLVDQQLILVANSAGRFVFDSWGLPWLSSASGLRIWLASSLESRWWKAIISHEADFDPHARGVLNEIVNKDNFMKEYFFLNYGFDIFHDHQVFDYILDITTFITAPNKKSSELSISNSQEMLSTLVEYEFNSIEYNLEQMLKLIAKYGSSVLLKIPAKLRSYL